MDHGRGWRSGSLRERAGAACLMLFGSVQFVIGQFVIQEGEAVHDKLLSETNKRH